MHLCYSVQGCACLCVCVKFRAEGSSSGSVFYLTVYEPLVNWLRRDGIPQITDIRTIKNLPEDLTLPGCVITSTCKALPC